MFGHLWWSNGSQNALTLQFSQSSRSLILDSHVGEENNFPSTLVDSWIWDIIALIRFTRKEKNRKQKCNNMYTFCIHRRYPGKLSPSNGPNPPYIQCLVKDKRCCEQGSQLRALIEVKHCQQGEPLLGRFKSLPSPFGKFLAI